MECSEIGSLTYKNLCETLSLKPSGNKRSTLSGDPATDILILLELSDQDLINVCATDKYINNLCNNESFWLNKVLSKFGLLGKGPDIKMRYMPTGTSWKEYYLWLSGLLDGPVEIARYVADENNREDLKILLGDYKTKTDRVERSLDYINNNLRGFLNEADFGPSDPSLPSLPLKDYLSVLKTGISGWAQIQKLFTIYTRIHKSDKLRKPYISANALMKKWFGQEMKSMGPNFDPDYFTLFHLGQLAKKMLVPTSDITSDQINLLEDSRIKERIKAENALLSRIIRK
jgi:hypothetical protein